MTPRENGPSEGEMGINPEETISDSTTPDTAAGMPERSDPTYESAMEQFDSRPSSMGLDAHFETQVATAKHQIETAAQTEVANSTEFDGFNVSELVEANISIDRRISDLQTIIDRQEQHLKNTNDEGNARSNAKELLKNWHTLSIMKERVKLIREVQSREGTESASA